MFSEDQRWQVLKTEKGWGDVKVKTNIFLVWETLEAWYHLFMTCFMDWNAGLGKNRKVLSHQRSSVEWIQIKTIRVYDNCQMSIGDNRNRVANRWVHPWVHGLSTLKHVCNPSSSKVQDGKFGIWIHEHNFSEPNQGLGEPQQPLRNANRTDVAMLRYEVIKS